MNVFQLLCDGLENTPYAILITPCSNGKTAVRFFGIDRSQLKDYFEKALEVVASNAAEQNVHQSGVRH